MKIVSLRQDRSKTEGETVFVTEPAMTEEVLSELRQLLGKSTLVERTFSVVQGELVVNSPPTKEEFSTLSELVNRAEQTLIQRQKQIADNQKEYFDGLAADYGIPLNDELLKKRRALEMMPKMRNISLRE